MMTARTRTAPNCVKLACVIFLRQMTSLVKQLNIEPKCSDRFCVAYDIQSHQMDTLNTVLPNTLLIHQNRSHFLIPNLINLEIHGPSGEYALSNVNILSGRAYCYARHKEAQCPVVIVIEYNAEKKHYKLFRVGKHNHSFDHTTSKSSGKSTAVDMLNIEVMASKINPELVGQRKERTPWMESLRPIRNQFRVKLEKF
jgi:hypothetical protein